MQITHAVILDGVANKLDVQLSITEIRMHTRNVVPLMQGMHTIRDPLNCEIIPTDFYRTNLFCEPTNIRLII